MVERSPQAGRWQKPGEARGKERKEKGRNCRKLMPREHCKKT
jgi:hypothetical protein